MTEVIPSQKDKLMADLKVVIADAEELLKMTAGQAGEKAAELRLRMQARLEQAKADLAHLQALAVDKARDAGKAADEFVHDHPWTVVGMAAGIGLVVGLLISRR